MFTLSCTDNRDKTIYLKGTKDCYLADIVYGEMSQFQFDILRDHYSKLNTLGGRSFMTAIVDEVDSMLIDDSSKIARLSSTVAGMDHFLALYGFIWQYLMSVKERFIMFNNKMYFIEGKVGSKNGRITLEVINDADGHISKISDLEAYIAREGNAARFIEIVEDMDKYLNKRMSMYLDHLMKDNQIYILSYFTEFVEKQKAKWITNAILAQFNYQENIDYVVQDGEIRPVDYYSTGIVQSSTSWSDGLHQFLQLKHNLKMTCETRTTNFLSNIGFIKKYQQVFGLTGTLGSDTARKVLRDVYEVDLINIPQRRKRQFFELSSVIAEGESNWLKEIMSHIILEVQKLRGILVICETIEHANRISGMLKQKLRPSSVKHYLLNDMGQEQNVETILAGEVIIATNLAGRGTDIHTDEIEETGGLHVILTFLPSNQRVEDQAFGRTARQGKRGTGIMILNAENLIGTRKDRDLLESKLLEELKEKDLKLIQIKDKFFEKFCTFLNDKIRIRIRQENTSCLRKIVNLLIETNPSLEEICTLAAVEEQWACFLSKLDEGEITCEDAEPEYKKLTDKLVKDYENKDVIKNPYYYITIANDILVNEWNLSGSSAKVKRALKYYNQAINLEREYWKREKEKEKMSLKEDDHTSITEDDFDLYSPGAAHLGVAWCLTLLINEKYKQNALASLNMAIKCFTQEMSVLNATQLLLQERQVGFPNSDLYKQMNTKATILGSYMRGIDNCIDAIKRSLRLISVVSVKTHEDGTLLETGTYFDEKERKEVEAILNENLQYSLEFHHLTRREDCGTRDQALTTLDNAYDESKNSKGHYCLNANSDNVRIHLNQVDFATVRSALFNPNKEFIDLTRESAIKILEEQRSYKHKFRVGESLSTQLKIHSNDKREYIYYKDKQMNELINIIEDQEISDNSLRFDIVISDGNVNEINTFLKSHQNKSQSPSNNRRPSSQISFQLHITFNNLDQENVEAKQNMIRAESFDIKFVLDKSALLMLIKDNTNLKSGVLFKSDNQGYDKLERQQLLEEITKLKWDETPCCIKFDGLSKEQVMQIINNCHKTVAFEICFKDVKDICFDSDFEPCLSNIIFDKINKKSGKVIIDLLRKHNVEFSLEFYNLSETNARFILKHADLDQEDLDVMKPKNIRDLFMKNSPPTIELNVFMSRGIEFIIVINEKEFVPWRSVCAVAALGTGQVILGSILMMNGFGTTVGMALVTEGIAELFTVYRIYRTRRFKWSDYCAQKSISMTISLVSMGVSKIKDTAKSIKILTNAVENEVLEQSGTQIIVNGKAVTTTLKETSLNLRSLTWKWIGVKASEEMTKEVLNTSVQRLSNFAFDHLKPRICEHLQVHVRKSFDDPKLKCLLYKMHAIDSKHLQSRIEQVLSVIIKRDTINTLLDSIGKALINGILSDSTFYGSAVNMPLRIIGILKGLIRTVTLFDTIVEKLKEKLSSIDRDTLTITLVLHIQLKISRNTSEIISKKLKEHKIFNEYDNFPDERIDKERFQHCRNDMLKECEDNDKSMKNDIEKSMDFVKRFHGEFINIEMGSFSEIMKVVSDKISDELVSIMDSLMLRPLSSLATRKLVGTVSQNIQHSCLVHKEQNSDRHKVDQEKYEELLEKDELTTDEKSFKDNYGKYRTFSEQLNYNSKDYCLAYRQCEIAHYSKKENGNINNQPDKGVTRRAIDIQDGAPASLAEMMAIAKKNGVNIKLVNTEDYSLTDEDRENGVQVIYFERGPNNDIGHAYYMDDRGRFVDAKPDSNTQDCVFIAFSNILEKKGIYKSHAVLRDETAQQILSNSTYFSKVLAAEKLVRTHHPNSFNDLLMTAGFCQKLKTGDLELKKGYTGRLVKVTELGEKETPWKAWK